MCSSDLWEKRSDFSPVSAGTVSAANDQALLASWRLLLDAGSLQDGESALAGTAHPSVAVISKNRAAALGVTDGAPVRISTKNGSVTLPVQIDEIDESSIWIPRNSLTSRAIADLGLASGPVSVVKA